MMWLKNDKSKEYNFMLYRLQKTVAQIKAKISMLKHILKKILRY